MKRHAIYIQSVSALLAIWLAVLGCSTLRSASPRTLQTETQSVDLGAAEKAQVRIRMAAGEMKVDSGADSLMNATFRYNWDDWKPQVNYTVNGSQGDLTVDHKDNNSPPITQNLINEWDIQLSNEVPIDLDIQTGAGKSTLNLNALDLTNLKVQSGAGESTIDLSGNWDHDVNAFIEGGAGKLTVMLPSDIGVRVDAQTGIGSVNAAGLTKEGDSYVNEAYGVSPYTLNLDIQAGIGAIDLQVP